MIVNTLACIPSVLTQAFLNGIIYFAVLFLSDIAWIFFYVIMFYM